MRVPDLDWPADLFTDVAPVVARSMLHPAGDRPADAGPTPLWPAMQGLWMRGIVRAGRAAAESWPLSNGMTAPPSPACL